MTTSPRYPTVRTSADGTSMIFECHACGGREELSLPLSLTAAAYRGITFSREHRTCAARARKAPHDCA